MSDSLTYPRESLSPLIPGLVLTGALAVGAIFVSGRVGSPLLSPMVLAMVAGIALRNLAPLPAAVAPGAGFATKRLLRIGIVLMGFRLTFADVAGVGLAGLAVVALLLAATFVAVKAMARVLGVERRLGELIAAGTSVCGASAVLAVNTVTRGEDEDVAYAIACVTVFGSLSMIFMPVLAAAMDLAPATYGLWVGGSVHEVAQVVGAGFARGDAAGHAATVAKLARVMMLAPLILTLGAMARRRGDGAGGKAPTPWFVFGFIAMVAVNSVVTLPQAVIQGLGLVTSLFLTMALAGMGLDTHIARLRLKGLRPLLLGAFGWIFIVVLGLGLATAIA